MGKLQTGKPFNPAFLQADIVITIKHNSVTGHTVVENNKPLSSLIIMKLANDLIAANINAMMQSQSMIVNPNTRPADVESKPIAQDGEVKP